MTLATLSNKPQSITGVRKKTRFILEKLKDLTVQKKFNRIIDKNKLAERKGKAADVQICIDCLINTYACYLVPQSTTSNYPKRKQTVLYNNLKTLEDKVYDAVKNKKPIPKRYVANVLKAQTILFNSIKSKRINKDCSEPYDKLILSSITVWNNEWQVKENEPALA